jgi:mycothiol synthase
MTTSKPPAIGAIPAAVPAAATSTANAMAVTPTAIPGLILRPVRWPEEAQLVADVNNAGRLAAGNLEVLTLDGFLLSYGNLVNCDLATDLRLAEHESRPVAYTRVEWRIENRGDRVHFQGLFTTPEAPDGTLEAILDWAEARSRAVAATLPADRPAVISAFLGMETPAGRAILEDRGYRAARFFFEMVRPDLEGIPDFALPAVVEVRSVRPGDLRTIFEAEVAAFRGHWGAGPYDGSDEHWIQFRDDPLNDLALWQIAWAGETVVGMVRPYINDEDFRVLGVRRGWCENISTHADWRGRGIARALIARALRALRDRGMTEAALGVDASNETGAVALYRSMGFVERTRQTDFRRPLTATLPAEIAR